LQGPDERLPTAGGNLRGHWRLLSGKAEIAETDSQRSDRSNCRPIADRDARRVEGSATPRVLDRRIDAAVGCTSGVAKGVSSRAQPTWGESLAGDADRGDARCVQRIGSATQLGSDVRSSGGER